MKLCIIRVHAYQLGQRQSDPLGSIAQRQEAESKCACLQATCQHWSASIGCNFAHPKPATYAIAELTRAVNLITEKLDSIANILNTFVAT